MRALRILLVEDDASIGALLVDMLGDMGHSVCGLETTEMAAIGAALFARPDLMIVDGRLGSGSGVAAVEAISMTMAIPHIFISGDRVSLGRVRAIVLQKPFSQRDFTYAIGRTMDAVPEATGPSTSR